MSGNGCLGAPGQTRTWESNGNQKFHIPRVHINGPLIQALLSNSCVMAKAKKKGRLALLQSLGEDGSCPSSPGSQALADVMLFPFIKWWEELGAEHDVTPGGMSCSSMGVGRRDPVSSQPHYQIEA